MRKKLIFFVLLVFFLGVIHNLVASISTLWEKRNVIYQAQKELELKKQENIQLKNQLAQAESPGFIEEQARDKLFLTKPGEQPVLIPQTMLKAEHPSPTPTPEPNWKQWVDVFVQ